MYSIHHVINQRVVQLRALLHEQQHEGLLITNPANCRYMSGFTGSLGSLLVTADAAFIFTDFRYRSQVMQETAGFTFYEISSQLPLWTALESVAHTVGIHSFAVEAEHLTLAVYDQLHTALQHTTPSIACKPTIGIVETLREVKSLDELVTLRRAVAITDAALEAVLPNLRPDYTERQTAWLLEVAMRERGADGVAFPIIVAAGVRAAMPHARPSDQILGFGRPIVIDMGAYYNGYHADMTRTVVLGEPDMQFHAIYSTVLKAQQHAIASIRVGMTGADADALAREQITIAGFGDAFGHGTGHGVGLDIHEKPRLGKGSTQQLAAGNVFSVEPGIYLEAWGGVRIEDLVLLHNDSCEVLSQASKQPVMRFI